MSVVPLSNGPAENAIIPLGRWTFVRVVAAGAAAVTTRQMRDTDQVTLFMTASLFPLKVFPLNRYTAGSGRVPAAGLDDSALT